MWSPDLPRIARIETLFFKIKIKINKYLDLIEIIGP